MRQLALAAYRAPEGLSGIRGPGETDTLNLATAAFFEKNYRRVLELLGTLPEEERQEVLSLRAHAWFNAGNFQAAARDFAELEAGSIYSREAQWFGLLSRMALPGANRAALKTELEHILAIAGHPYRDDAAALNSATISEPASSTRSGVRAVRRAAAAQGKGGIAEVHCLVARAGDEAAAARNRPGKTNRTRYCFGRAGLISQRKSELNAKCFP